MYYVVPGIISFVLIEREGEDHVHLQSKSVDVWSVEGLVSKPD